MSEEEQQEQASKSANAFLALLESTASLIEVTTGYRQNCISAGFSKESADEMAVQMHGFMLQQILRQS